MKKNALLFVAVLALLAGGGWFLYSTGFFQAASSLEGLRTYISRFAPFSYLFFFLVQFLSVVLAPIPSNITGPPSCSPSGPWQPGLCWCSGWPGFWEGILRTESSAKSCLRSTKPSCGPKLRFF